MDAKQIKNIVSGIFGMMFRLLFTFIMIIVVYRAAVSAYNFGYLVFADIPLEIAPGRTKVVTVADGTNNWEVAKTLEENGIISNAMVFYIQIMLSDYKESLQSGMHELNTSMNSEELIEVLAGVAEEEEEESDS